MGVQRDVGGNPSIPPSSFWAQRSAQLVGICEKILSECIRISMVAFGMGNSYSRASAPYDFLPSAPLRFLLFLALRAWVR